MGVSARDNRNNVDLPAHVVNQIAHQTVVRVFSATVIDPDTIQASLSTVSILPVETEWALNGITLTRVGIKTQPSSTYSVTLVESANPTDGSPATIVTIATSGSTEASTATLTDANIAGDTIIQAILPATDVKEVLIWGTFTIDST